MASTSAASNDILDLDVEEDGETAGEIFKKLTTAWVNEKCCPDLLKHNNDLVDCMMDQMKQMDENLKILNFEDFIVVPHSMEIERIRYVISSYLRTRLQKIEMYTSYLLKRDKSIANEEDRYMSKAEFEFAEKFLQSMLNHFRKEVCGNDDDLKQLFENIDVDVEPENKSVVTIKVLRNIEGVLIKGTPVDLEVDCYHMLPFNDIKHLIESGLAVCI